MVPTGTILMFGRATPPSGFLNCDGSAVSRSTYADLFSVIGTAFGHGDGTTTFNLPDFRARMPIGAGGGTSNQFGNLGDTDPYSTVADRSPTHTHALADSTTDVSDATAITVVPSGSIEVSPFSHTHPLLGESDDNFVLPPYAVVNFIVKL